MKKLFTLALALLGMTTVANAAGPDDIVETKHSMVMVFDQYTGNGTQRGAKGTLFGAKHFLDVTGGSVATNKGQATLGDASTLTPFNCTQEEVEALAAKYAAKYNTPQYNSLRLKNAQDVIAAKFTAGSVIWVIGQGNNKSGKDARIPKFATDAALNNALNAAPTADDGSTPAGYVYKWTCPDDGLYYIGSYNGDAFFSYIVVEANEAPGTPQVEVGEQTFADGRWFVEVSADAVLAEDGMETVVYYTTDGSAVVGEDGTVSATAKEYTAPVKMYKDGTVKFQAFYKALVSLGLEAAVCPNADNEGTAEFQFAAPAIAAEGGNVTITTEYENAKNYYTLNDGKTTGEAVQGDAVTLDLSATVAAYTVIDNGEGIEFTTLKSTKDVYVLNPITEKKTIVVTGGEVVVDEEATKKAQEEGKDAKEKQTVYTVKDGTISADPMDFFVKDLTFKVVNDREVEKDAQYQVPAGQEIYIQMSNTNISFKIDAPVKVKVVTTLNSCKTLNPTDDENITTDRKNYVNISGTTYGNEDVTAENGNIIEFELPAMVDVKDEEGNVIGQERGELAKDGIYTFLKYSGTGNIIISSIEIEPLGESGEEAEDVVVWENGVQSTVPEANWNGDARFSNAANATGEETYIIPDAQWETLKAAPFVIEVEAADPAAANIVVCNGWWGGRVDYAGADVLKATADGTYTMTVDLAANSDILSEIDPKHLLFTGQNYTLKKIIIPAGGATSIDSVAAESKSNVMFNLNGQRVNSAKGLVVKNGKLIFVK